MRDAQTFELPRIFVMLNLSSRRIILYQEYDLCTQTLCHREPKGRGDLGPDRGVYPELARDLTSQ